MKARNYPLNVHIHNQENGLHRNLFCNCWNKLSCRRISFAPQTFFVAGSINILFFTQPLSNYKQFDHTNLDHPEIQEDLRQIFMGIEGS